MYIFENFEAVSGLKINTDKTEILKIGAAKNSKVELLKPYKFKWKTSIKTLGVQLWNDLNETLSRNYTKKIATIKTIANIWTQRELTMYGKVLISKTLILSQFNYLLSSLPSPGSNITGEIDNIILSFIRSYRSPQKLSKDILKLDKTRGGLKVTLMHEQGLGLKVTWVTRLLSDSQQGWKILVNRTIPLKNNDFWLCNFSPSYVHAILNQYKNIPVFWKDVISKWAEYNFFEPKTIEEILSQPLWFNSLILNGNRDMIFYTQWYDAGIFKILDIVVNGRLANFEEISEKFGIPQRDRLKYYGLISMLPPNWKRAINNRCNISMITNLNINKIYNISKLKSKAKICSTVVASLRDNMKTFPEIAFLKWKTNLNIEFEKEEFLDLFTKMYTLTKDNKILIFNYRLLHRNTITNKNLNLWDNNKPPEERHTDKCTFCNIFIETIEHLFYDCVYIKQIWEDLFNWVYEKCSLRIGFSRGEIILNNSNDDLKIFNLIFMIVKKQIHTIRCLKTRPNFNSIKYHITQYYKAEEKIALKNNHLTHFLAKWDPVINCFVDSSLPTRIQY